MKYTSTKTLLDIEFEHLNKRVAGVKTGFTSGYIAIDKSLGGSGFEPGLITVFAGRPGMGSSLISLNVLVNQLMQLNDSEVLIYITTKDSSTVILQRILAIAHDIEIAKIQNGDLNVHELNSMQDGSFCNKKLHGLVLVEHPSPSIEDMQNLLFNLVKDGKSIRSLTIDTLQNVKTDSSITKDQGVAQMLKELRVAAIQFQFSIIVTSEVSRRVEYRDGPKIPQLKDLKDSRLIADKVDFVYFVLRPMYYEVPGEDETISDEMHLICKKNKYGPLDLIDLTVDLKTQRITNGLTFTKI